MVLVTYQRSLIVPLAALFKFTTSLFQIELDLRRTLPNNKYFEEESSEGIPKLRRILLAYSYHNPVIGYCQVSEIVQIFHLYQFYIRFYATHNLL